MLRRLVALLLPAVGLYAAGMRAGSARVDITPQGPFWMSGYAARTHPSTGVLHPLWAKALILDDGAGHRVVIVTTDLIGLPRAVTDAASARLAQEKRLDRASLWFNSSHTHTGPAIRENLPVLLDLGPADAERIAAYTRELTDKLVTVVSAAMGDLAPATIDFGTGQANFAINRRQPLPDGVVIGVNHKGPVDHRVPVLRVRDAKGREKAIVVAYACHNTTLTAEFYELSGDYAGFAQAEIEKAHTGANAMFVQLCGGDQNPNPRSTLELAQEHGAVLAREVDRVIQSGMLPLKGRIQSAFESTELRFAQRGREDFEKEAATAKIAAARRRANLMLKYLDERRPIFTTPYPVQALRIGNGLTILTLGGEVVIDYNLRARREYPGPLMVAGYSNDVMCYIPSARVLKEGGYEAVDSMIYYGQPGPFADDVEERVFAAVHRVMRRVGLKPEK